MKRCICYICQAFSIGLDWQLSHLLVFFCFIREFLFYSCCISDDIIDDEKFKTWSVSSKTLPDQTVLLTVGGTDDQNNPNSFHGFIKDLVRIY